jgi:hypothetical protein
MLNRKTTSPAIAALAAALAAFVVGPSAGAATTEITTCGQTVTTSAVLTQDLSCAGDGIVVGASGITIDLGGHTLRGDRSFGDFGIDGGFAFDVTIKNGIVRDFDEGVWVVGGVGNVSITNVVSTGNAEDGIVVNRERVSITSSSASGNGTYGILASGKASVKSTTAAANGSYGDVVAGRRELGQVVERARERHNRLRAQGQLDFGQLVNRLWKQREGRLH